MSRDHFGDLAITGGTPIEVNWTAVATTNFASLEVIFDLDQDPNNGNEISAAYPELAGLASSLADGTVVDGEVVAFRDGRPSFERLQARMHLRDGRRVTQAAVDNPIVFMAFDILRDAGEDLTGQPLTGRRARLGLCLGLPTVDRSAALCQPRLCDAGPAGGGHQRAAFWGVYGRTCL